MGFWSQLQLWAIDAFSAEKISPPFASLRWQSFFFRQWLNALGSGTLAFVWFTVVGVPACSDLLILGLPFAPVTIGLLNTKAELAASQALSSLSFVAAGLIAALSAGALHQTSFLWFLIAAVEGIFSAKRVLAAASGILASLTALMVALFAKGDAMPVPEAGGYAPFLVPAIVLALIAATGFVRFRALDRGGRKILAEPDDRIADTMGCLALRFGLSGRVSSVSSNCKSLFNLAPGELMERGFFDRIQVADRPAFLQAISDASAKAVPAATTLRWRGPARAEHVGHVGHPGPVFHWLEMRAHRGEAAPLFKPRDGNVVAFFRDVTEAKCRFAELENARADLAEADIAREHFFAQAGHEIRAPLNAIAGFSELLAASTETPPEPEKQRDYVRIIHQSAQHLVTLVNSLTDMSLIRSGRLAIALERFAAAPQIDLCCNMLELQARNKGVLLLRAYSANLDTIFCDRRLFTQILVNLLANAIKFTPANGRVTLIARAEASSLLVKVTDTGIGIDAEDLGHLGDPFFQAKRASERKDKGTGLGLSIVRGFVGMLGGEIMVASEPEKGTCVRVRLPLESQALTGAAKGPVRIATLARLPLPDEPYAIQQMMVKKIA